MLSVLSVPYSLSGAFWGNLTIHSRKHRPRSQPRATSSADGCPRVRAWKVRAVGSAQRRSRTASVRTPGCGMEALGAPQHRGPQWLWGVRPDAGGLQPCLCCACSSGPAGTWAQQGPDEQSFTGGPVLLSHVFWEAPLSYSPGTSDDERWWSPNKSDFISNSLCCLSTDKACFSFRLLKIL